MASRLHVTGMPCVYVGMTGLDPDVRFDNHKAGIRSNKYVTRFGMRLMTELFEHLNPMPYGDASTTHPLFLQFGIRKPTN